MTVCHCHPELVKTEAKLATSVIDARSNNQAEQREQGTRGKRKPGERKENDKENTYKSWPVGCWDIFSVSTAKQERLSRGNSSRHGHDFKIITKIKIKK